MSPADLLIDILTPGNDLYAANRVGFYQGTKFTQLMNIIAADSKGLAVRNVWLRPLAIDLVVAEVHSEMDLLSVTFKMAMKDTTPEFLMEFDLEKHITRILARDSPWLQRILLAAAQTSRAARENTTTNPIAVSSLCYAILYVPCRLIDL